MTKRFTTEEIIHKLREADVLIGQGSSVACMGSQQTPKATSSPWTE